MAPRYLYLATAAFASFTAVAQISPTATSEIADARPAISNVTPVSLTPMQRGDIFMARKMYREAVDTYRQADVSSALIVNKIGIAYHQMLELEIAKKHYERSLKLNPDYSEARNNLGTIWYAKKNYRRAINEYKKAIKLNPNSASIHSNLGTAYFARKNYDEALKEYEIALSIDPDVFERRGTAGVLLQERSVEERAKFHYYLAKTYAKAGADDRALLYLRKALEEGLKDRNQLKDAPEFAKLRENPEFQALLTYEPRIL